VALATDIKAMFQHVCVAEPDREALRFLWWPGNDLTQPPVDYAMNVFLFWGNLFTKLCSLCSSKNC